MKIVIVGPGAMGCLLAGLLIRAGNDVTLLDYLPDRAEELSNKGLRIETGNIAFTVPVRAIANTHRIDFVDITCTVDAFRGVPCVPPGP